MFFLVVLLADLCVGDEDKIAASLCNSLASLQPHPSCCCHHSTHAHCFACTGESSICTVESLIRTGESFTCTDESYPENGYTWPDVHFGYLKCPKPLNKSLINYALLVAVIF